MKQRFLVIGLLFIALSFGLLSSCTDPIDAGAGLLEEDRAGVGFTDTLSVEMKTIIADSVLTYSASFNAQLSDYLFGKTEDEFFGTTETSLYLLPVLLTDILGLREKFTYSENAQIDSIVLVLPIDTAGTFGDVNSVFEVEVYQIDERIDYESSDALYYSNTTFLTSLTPLTTATFHPSFDSAFVTKRIRENSLDTAIIAPHVRIPLPMELGAQFFGQDSTVFDTDSAFVDFFKGLYLKPVSANEGMLDFNIFLKRWGGMYFYYKDMEPDSTYEYVFPIGPLSGRISNYNHNYDTALAGEFIESTEKEDSLVFLQGLQGLFTKIEIPNLSSLSGKIINKAELELNVATIDGYDTDLDSPAPQIILFTRNSDGDLQVIDDVAISPNDLSLFFGGRVEEQGDGTLTYFINLSIHLQKMLDGDEPNEIFLSIFPRTANPSRVILNGGGVSVKPAQLKVSFTDI